MPIKKNYDRDEWVENPDNGAIELHAHGTYDEIDDSRDAFRIIEEEILSGE